MREFRRFIRLIVPAVGMALVIGAVLFGEQIGVQLFLVLAGLLLTEAGMGRLAEPILPNERKYLALRAETEHFTELVRQLNAAALVIHDENDGGRTVALDEIREEMHRSIDRMVTFAGKTNAQLPPDGTDGPLDSTSEADGSATASVGA